MAADRPDAPRPRRLSTAAKRKLRQPLAPEHISERETGDGPVRYLEGWRAIQLANAIFGEDRWGAAGVGSVMLLTIHYHLRRAHLAARRRIPEDVALGWTCYPSLHYTSRNWFEVERGRRDVTSEIEKIERYYGLKLADLPELDG